MEGNYFKDLLFDEINESDLLNIADITCDDRQNLFVVTMQDGTEFEIKINKR